MRLVDQINNYIQEQKPWETAKNIENISKTEISCCTVCCL